jgi:hypothetical protein
MYMDKTPSRTKSFCGGELGDYKSAPKLGSSVEEGVCEVKIHHMFVVGGCSSVPLEDTTECSLCSKNIT